MQAVERIEQYKKIHGKAPGALWLANTAKISHDEAERLAKRANHGDFMTVHRIALGLNDPKGEQPGDGQEMIISPPNGLDGVASSPG